MATVTLVLTYTAGSSSDNTIPDSPVVTSLTVDGTAYGSCTNAQLEKAAVLMRRAYATMVKDGKAPVGWSATNITS